MAFNFAGTFTTGQWEAFKAFAQIQKRDLSLRKQWLQRELIRVGVFSTTFDETGTKPISYVATGYAGKLLTAYKILGGVPEQSMLLRTRDKPVFKTKSAGLNVQVDGTTDGGFSDVYSNGRRERGGQRFDRDLCIRVEKLKKWQLEAIKFKREKIEYKIKKALDYSDQIQQEIVMIDKLLSVGLGSFEDQLVSIEVIMTRPGSANIVSNLDDQFGLNIGRPNDKTFADANVRKESLAERGT